MVDVACNLRLALVVVLSCSIDFYIRVFVRVYTSPAAAKLAPTKARRCCSTPGSPHFVSALEANI